MDRNQFRLELKDDPDFDQNIAGWFYSDNMAQGGETTELPVPKRRWEFGTPINPESLRAVELIVKAIESEGRLSELCASPLHNFSLTRDIADAPAPAGTDTTFEGSLVHIAHPDFTILHQTADAAGIGCWVYCRTMRPINVAFFQEKLRWFSHIVIQESFQDRQARVLEERNRATKSYEDAQLIIEASRILLDNLVWLSPQMQFLRHCLHPSSANLIALLKAPVEYIPGISNDLLEHDWTQASAGANWPKFAAQLRSILLCHRGVEFNALTVADEYRKECGTGDQAATLRALERTGRWPHLCLDGLLVEDKPEPEVPASLVQLFEVFKSSSFYTGQDADPVLTFGQVFVVASQLGVTVETQDLPGLLKRIHWGKPLLLRTSCLHSFENQRRCRIDV
jgi:hypothetical protein